ncbi:MAG TPA: hypothetical protein VN961_21215 [Streptosporangiaceae bacterium]|nr:hypothetical protein [Streptosporangiaceae bacterium]
MREDVDGLDPYRSGNTLQWEAFESLQPGHVLVVDSYRTAPRRRRRAKTC